MKSCGPLDTEGQCFAIACAQHRAYIAKSQATGDPDHQAIEWKYPQKHKKRHRYVATYQEKGVETLAKHLAQAHRQRAFVYRQVVLVVTHIVHVENSCDQKADGHAGEKSLPRPAGNLYVVGSPGHQQTHCNVDQDIPQPTCSEFERLRAIKVGNSHTGQSKQNNPRATGIDQHEAEHSRDDEAADTPGEYLRCRHFVPEDHRGSSQGFSCIKLVAIVKVFVEVIRADLQEEG